MKKLLVIPLVIVAVVVGYVVFILATQSGHPLDNLSDAIPSRPYPQEVTTRLGQEFRLAVGGVAYFSDAEIELHLTGITNHFGEKIGLIKTAHASQLPTGCLAEYFLVVEGKEFNTGASADWLETGYRVSQIGSDCRNGLGASFIVKTRIQDLIETCQSWGEDWHLLTQCNEVEEYLPEHR